MTLILVVFLFGCNKETPVAEEKPIYPFYQEGLTIKDGERTNTDFCNVISNEVVDFLDYLAKTEWSSKMGIDLIRDSAVAYSVDIRTSYGGAEPAAVVSIRDPSTVTTTFGIANSTTYLNLTEKYSYDGVDGIRGKVESILPITAISSGDNGLLRFGISQILPIEGDIIYGIGAYGKTSEYIASMKVSKMLESLHVLSSNQRIGSGGGGEMVEKLNSSVITYINSAFGLNVDTLEGISTKLPDITLTVHLVMESSGTNENLLAIYIKFRSPASETSVFGGAEKSFDIKIHDFALSVNIDAYNATESLGDLSLYGMKEGISDAELFTADLFPNAELRSALRYARETFNDIYAILNPTIP